MPNILKIDSYKTLIKLPNHTQGEIAFCSEDNKYYLYNNGWEETKITMNNEGIELNLFELNRNAIKQLGPLNETRWLEAESLFNEWYENNLNTKYFLLYGKEISYFTLFKRTKSYENFGTFYEILKECLNDVGEVYDFGYGENDKVIEIWIKPYDQENVTFFGLFEYDNGVVAFNG